MMSPSAIREMLLRAAALALIAGAAAPAWAQDQSSQEIHDRLVGKQPSSAAPSSAAGDAQCATAADIENNPACASSVSGPGRPWSLTGHAAAQAPGAAQAGAPAAPARGRATSARVAGARRTKSEAAPCGLDQAGEARSVNLCLTFAVNSATLTTASRASLDNLAAALSQSDLQARKVVIGGYADATGNARHNTKLSGERAKAALDYLVAHGVAVDRLTSKGYGSSHPLPGHDPRDPTNRRVEAVLAN
jgi:outer membrane protein OmpA-like peptidoglycan-associated protein